MGIDKRTDRSLQIEANRWANYLLEEYFEEVIDQNIRHTVILKIFLMRFICRYGKTNNYAIDKYGRDYKNMKNYSRYKASYDVYKIC